MRLCEKKKLNKDVAKHIKILGAAVGSIGDLATAIGIDRATMYRRIKNPEKITLAELRELNDLARKEGLNYTFT